MSKIGIYSGTFDPIHDGHLAFVEAAINQLAIDKLYMLAEPTPWRKSDVTDLKHRQAMLELAVKDHPKIVTTLPGMADRHDIESTMKVLADTHPNDKIVLLMGADVFINIDKWQGYKDLIDRVEFAVALRTEDDGEELVYKMIDLPKAKVTKIVTDKSTLSSSKVKAELSFGKIPKGISDKTLEYISQNKLYES